MAKSPKNLLALAPLLVLLVAPWEGQGAPFAIDSWTTEKGLPQNSVIAMTLADDGYLWLGTLSGLVRFDGVRFPVFDANNTPELRSGQIVHLFEDSQGNLWIGTLGAGVALARRNGTVTNLTIGRAGQGGRLQAACEDEAGAVWLYTADGELCRYRKAQMDVFNMEADRPSYRRSVIRGEQGRVLVGTDQNIYVISPTGNRGPKELPIEETNRVGQLDFLLTSQRGGYWRMADGQVQRWTSVGLASELGPYPWSSGMSRQWPHVRIAVTSACEDQNGNVVVGTLGAGVFWSDGAGKWTNLSTNDGLSSNQILSMQIDREGTLWVGTDGNGLNRIRRHIFEVLESSRGQVVQSVSEDRSGGLYIGYNNIGVDYWSNGVLKKVNTGPDMMNMSVKAVFVDREQRVWAGTSAFLRAGLFQLYGGQFQRVASSLVANRDVSALHEDSQGRLWVGTRGGLVVWDGGGWKAFSTRDGLSADDVSAIAHDREGGLWVGTRGGGLNRLHQNRFTVFRRTKGGLPADDISALLVDHDDVLWVGTDGGGIARFQAGKWTRYSTEEGLISNSITYLLEDEQGFLWSGSSAGLMRISKKSLNDLAKDARAFLPLRAYGQLDGLPIGECTRGSQPAACRTSRGKLLFPTIHGLAIVDPTQLRTNSTPPPVTIEAVLVGGVVQGAAGLRTPRPEAATIPAGQESLEIHYTSLNLSAPTRARFRYRLERHEKEWFEAGDARVAHYSKLPAGQYRFLVTACNEDGVWNETGAVLGLTVLPPFYLTWWFLTTASAALLGGIVSVVRYFSVQKLERQLAVMRQHEALEKERARIARDIHDQLGASLTQVTLLGEMVEADKDQASEVETHARQICQTARDTTRTLDEIVWTVNPSNDTLEGLANYICKYAQDYLGVADVRYRLDVPAELPPTPIPPEVRHNVFLAAKEAVTNVVRHAKASSAWIRLKLEPGCFRLEIADDGRGLAGMDAQRAAARNGLRNMRKRMEDVGGTFEMGPAPEGGVQVRLTVPLAK